MLGLNSESESGLGLELGCIQYIKLLIQYIKLLIQYTINWVAYYYYLSLPIRKKVEKYIRNTHIFENCVYTYTHFIRKVRVYTQKSSLRIYARTAYGQTQIIIWYTVHSTPKTEEQSDEVLWYWILSDPAQDSLFAPLRNLFEDARATREAEITCNTPLLSDI